MKAELVVIFAHWCQKCNLMMPVIDEIERECEDLLFVTRVEVVDEEADLPSEYGIELVPAFIIKKNGEELGRMSGIIGKELMVRRIKSVV